MPDCPIMTVCRRIAGKFFHILGVAAAFGGGQVQAAEPMRTFAVNYAAKPDVRDLCAVDFSVLDPSAQVDLKVLHQAGRKALAYVSVVEVNDKAPWLADLKKAGVKLQGANAQWQSRLADTSSPAWQEFVVNRIAKTAVGRGFDGLFLDTADSVELLAKADPEKAGEYRVGLVQLIQRLRRELPGREILINRGFDLLPALKGSVDGVLVESVLQTFDAKGQYHATTPAARSWLKGKIAEVQAGGLPVYALDYMAPGTSAAEADAVAAELRTLGVSPLIATRDLQGQTLGPVRHIARRVLVLYGAVLAENEVAEQFAVDSMAGERLQMPLEWMGYEVDYLNVGRQSPPLKLAEDYCGIIFDAHVTLPYAGEGWYADWILDHVKRGLKVVFCGKYPFDQDVQRLRVLQGLGCWGSFSQVPKPEEVKLLALDRKVMGFEANPSLHAAEIEDTRAPQGSRLIMSVGSVDEAANKLRYDTLYTCSWGGAVLEPYATFQVSAEDQASLFDPFAFLQDIFPAGRFPAPDNTTRDGRRIFFSHIDGDGFQGMTHFTGTKICGELVRDDFLKKYPLPVAVSLIEASMRCMEEGQDPAMQPRYEEVARSIFQLPNVQAASHSFTHPYVWIDNDEEYIPQYETRALVLKDEFAVEGVDPEREVAGSIAYVNSLLPEGKKCDLMLWSGNCRPGAAAIQACRKLGVENVNGGGATISKRHPYLSNIGPRVMQWDGEVQVHAAMENEFVFTRNWTGPFQGGFRHVIDTFNYTETPRRLKPVNVYYHFYSTATPGASRALAEIYDWCMGQPLHSMTTVEFAKLTRDSHTTRLYAAGPSRWVAVNEGRLRTFRLPAGKAVPDMAACRGVTGYVQDRDVIYIHTDGTTAAEIALTETPAPHLRLESSMVDVSFTALRADRAELKVSDLRPEYSLVLAGAAPGSEWITVVNGKSSVLTADAAGRLSFKLGGTATLSVEPKPGVAAN